MYRTRGVAFPFMFPPLPPVPRLAPRGLPPLESPRLRADHSRAGRMGFDSDGSTGSRFYSPLPDSPGRGLGLTAEHDAIGNRFRGRRDGRVVRPPVPRALLRPRVRALDARQAA